MKRFLFQGDSITDASRDRNYDRCLGKGYAAFMGADITSTYPGEYEFINKGIACDRIVDIYQRIKVDIINLRPDYLSILIGINDLWGDYCLDNGVDAVKFEKIYGMLIEEIKEALPGIKIILLEPYVLKGEACEWGSGTAEHWDKFKTDIIERGEIVKRVAEKYNLTFVPLREKFNELAEKYGSEIWVYDGVHPTPAGHRIIADSLKEAFLKMVL